MDTRLGIRRLLPNHQPIPGAFMHSEHLLDLDHRSRLAAYQTSAACGHLQKMGYVCGVHNLLEAKFDLCTLKLT